MLVDVEVSVVDVLVDVEVSVVVVLDVVEVSVVVVLDVVEVSVVDVSVEDVGVSVEDVDTGGDVIVGSVVEEESVANATARVDGLSADAATAGTVVPTTIVPIANSGRAAPVNRERVRRAISVSSRSCFGLSWPLNRRGRQRRSERPPGRGRPDRSAHSTSAPAPGAPSSRHRVGARAPTARVVGVAGFEPAAFRSQSGRATKLRHTPYAARERSRGDFRCGIGGQ